MSKVTGTVKIPEMEIKESVELPSSGTAIIVVDMQNDFVKPNGKLYVPTAQATVPAIRKLLMKARDANVPIIYTQDWHFKNDPEFRIWGGEHCVMDTWGGAEIVDELKPMPSDIVIRKRRYDAFFGTDLDYVLRHVVHATNLVIVGTVANICVLHTAGSAALNWYNVVVPIDGISALNEFDYYAALRQISFLYKGTLTKVDGVKFT
ncbi:isochorismatase family cysteine hydrolase [Vulcanisaeta distributa]|uniref:cysteine hydrolase family protein n=1 Tax=Vulcanisaeta distributa TaxID=164451 RepID=UPI0006D0B69F|nr:isochorismatase family cysteine hydrolase [Vulcanisaeta distributa]